jgi:hypothetical protein
MFRIRLPNEPLGNTLWNIQSNLHLSCSLITASAVGGSCRGTSALGGFPGEARDFSFSSPHFMMHCRPRSRQKSHASEPSGRRHFQINFQSEQYKCTFLCTFRHSVQRSFPRFPSLLFPFGTLRLCLLNFLLLKGNRKSRTACEDLGVALF